MENMYVVKRTTMLFLGVVTTLVVSGYSITPLSDLSDLIDNALVDEKISRPVAADVTLPKLPLLSPTVAKLKLADNAGDLTYVALGGSLSAGFRNGGLSREGQLGASPNLLARQLGLTNFRSPLFDVENGNGTGYYLLEATDSYPRWQQIDNNKAIVSTTPFTLQKYAGGSVHNLSMPYLGLNEVYTKGFATDILKAIPAGNLKPYPNAFLKYPGYLQRLLPTEQEGTKSIWDLFTAQKADFCTVEMGLDLFLGAAQHPRNVTISLSDGSAHFPLMKVLDHLQKTGSKAVVFTIPHVLDWPYFHIYELNDFQQKTNKKPLYVREANNDPTPVVAKTGTLFIPTAKIDATFRTLTSGIGLSREKPCGR